MTDHETRRSARGQPISVLVPVHNFGHGVQQFLDMWRKPLEDVSHKCVEIIVIDDASTDATTSIVESYTARHAEVTLLRHDTHRGVGAALRTGVAASRHPYVLFLCPDWAYQPSDIIAIAEAMSGADVVAPVRPGVDGPRWLRRSGSVSRFLARWVLGMDFGPPAAWHGWGPRFRRLRYRQLFGLRLQDPTCGLRLLRKSVLVRCPIQSDGSFALVEMYAKANFVGALFHEVELKRPGTAPVLREGLEMRHGDQKRVFRSPVFQSGVC